MSQSDVAIPSSKKIGIPKYLIISVLTILAIGPQYFLNLSYTLSQVVIQNGLHLSPDDMRIPSILTNLAFALGVPLGRIFSRRFGIRNSYLTLITLFLCGSLIDAFSAGLFSLLIGKGDTRIMLRNVIFDDSSCQIDFVSEQGPQFVFVFRH